MSPYRYSCGKSCATDRQKALRKLSAHSNKQTKSPKGGQHSQQQTDKKPQRSSALTATDRQTALRELSAHSNNSGAKHKDGSYTIPRNTNVHTTSQHGTVVRTRRYSGRNRTVQCSAQQGTIHRRTYMLTLATSCRWSALQIRRSAMCPKPWSIQKICNVPHSQERSERRGKHRQWALHRQGVARVSM